MIEPDDDFCCAVPEIFCIFAGTVSSVLHMQGRSGESNEKHEMERNFFEPLKEFASSCKDSLSDSVSALGRLGFVGINFP